MKTPRAAVALVLVLVLALVACSTAYSPASLDAGVDASTSPGPDSGASSTDASDAESAPADSADANDAGTVACTRNANGNACNDPSECCSSACGTTNTCIPECTTNAACIGTGGRPCCLHYYCSPGHGGECAPCVPFGAFAERDVGTNAPLAASCCSGKIDSMGACTI